MVFWHCMKNITKLAISIQDGKIPKICKALMCQPYLIQRFSQKLSIDTQIFSTTFQIYIELVEWMSQKKAVSSWFAPNLIIHIV